ncbi:SCO family protein [Bacillus timonensis]|nr:SCO family protein [Bacillus timonensis]
MITMLLVTACSNNEIENPLNWKVSSFSYTNQNEEEVQLSDFKNKVWVANFIFTNCDTVCSPMTAHMSKLQNMAKEEGLDVTFVSFSVDPEIDSPSILKEFGQKFDADFGNWHFLTGYSPEEIKEFAEKNFKTLALKPKDSDQVMHGTSFYLVNKDGIVVKDYSGVEDTPYEQIIQDIKSLN